MQREVGERCGGAVGDWWAVLTSPEVPAKVENKAYGHIG